MTNQVVENFIGCYDNMLLKQECEDIITFFENESKNVKTFFRHKEDEVIRKDESWWEYAPESSLNNYEIGPTELVEFRVPSDLFKPIKIKILKCFQDYAQRWGVLFHGQKYILSPGVKIQKTNPGQGYHVWHYESSSKEVQSRTAVYTVYLNDDFDAGETEFLYMQSRVKPKTGSVVLFPSGFTHTHRGNPPIGNSKYILTGWIELAE
jgi:hypothetical protein